MQPLSAILPKVLDQKRNKAALYGARLMDAWPAVIEEVLGDDASMGSRVEALRGGTLVIRTNSSALASELRFHSHRIVPRLNKRVKRRIVTSFRFRM